jgi:hypothetical protein
MTRVCACRVGNASAALGGWVLSAALRVPRAELTRADDKQDAQEPEFGRVIALPNVTATSAGGRSRSSSACDLQPSASVEGTATPVASEHEMEAAGAGRATLARQTQAARLIAELR